MHMRILSTIFKLPVGRIFVIFRRYLDAHVFVVYIL